MQWKINVLLLLKLFTNFFFMSLPDSFGFYLQINQWCNCFFFIIRTFLSARLTSIQTVYGMASIFLWLRIQMWADEKQTAAQKQQTWSSWEFKFLCLLFRMYEKREWVSERESHLLPNVFALNEFIAGCRTDEKYTRIKFHHNLIYITKRSRSHRLLARVQCSLTLCREMTTTTRQKFNCSELIFSICDTLRARFAKVSCSGVHKTVNESRLVRVRGILLAAFCVVIKQFIMN